MSVVAMMAVIIGVINVNGADSSLPTNLPSGIVGWYAAGHGVTNRSGAVATDGDLVGTWVDQSGNGYTLRDYAYSAYSNAPTYIANSAGGQPALQFGVIEDKSDVMRSDDLSSSSNNVVGSIFIVFQPNTNINNSSASQALVDFTYSSGNLAINLGQVTSTFNNEIITVFGEGTNASGDVANTRSGWLDPADSIPSNIVHFLSVIHNTVLEDFDIYLDGVKIDNAKDQFQHDMFTMERINIGHHANVWNDGLFAYQGLISEVILFDSALDVTDQATVEDYLNNKYNPPRGTIIIIH